MQTISSGDRPDSIEVNKQTFPTTVGGLVGLNRQFNTLKRYKRISYGQVQGSEYNARTGNNVAICPRGAKKKRLI